MSDRAPDPFAVFSFIVEVGGIEVGGFSQVAGLERSTTFEEYREGGVNDRVHKLATVTKYPNLTLRRGLTDAQELWAWHEAVIAGEVLRQDVAVVLKDYSGRERRRWVFEGAYPVKWNGTDLDAASSTVAVESVEFAHWGMRS